MLTFAGFCFLSCTYIHRRNWPEKDNTWEPFGHVARCRDILEEFEARYTCFLPEYNVMYICHEMISFGSLNLYVENGLVDTNFSSSLVLGFGY